MAAPSARHFWTCSLKQSSKGPSNGAKRRIELRFSPKKSILPEELGNANGLDENSTVRDRTDKRRISRGNEKN